MFMMAPFHNYWMYKSYSAEKYLMVCFVTPVQLTMLLLSKDIFTSEPE